MAKYSVTRSLDLVSYQLSLDSMRRYKISLSVGKKIRITRRKLGLTQEELSEKVSLHVSTLGRIERGEMNSPIQTINKIATALKIKPKELLP